MCLLHVPHTLLPTSIIKLSLEHLLHFGIYFCLFVCFLHGLRELCKLLSVTIYTVIVASLSDFCDVGLSENAECALPANGLCKDLLVTMG